MSYVGRTASTPYTRAKSVWPVARFGVVLIDQRTAGNSSMQPVKSLCPQASQHFSICPLRLAVAPWMCHGSETDLATDVLDVLHEGVACELCAVVGDDLLGIPKRQTSPLKNLTADCAVTFLTASTSGHLVNLSIATYKY